MNIIKGGCMDIKLTLSIDKVNPSFFNSSGLSVFLKQCDNIVEGVNNFGLKYKPLYNMTVASPFAKFQNTGDNNQLMVVEISPSDVAAFDLLYKESKESLSVLDETRINYNFNEIYEFLDFFESKKVFITSNDNGGKTLSFAFDDGPDDMNGLDDISEKFSDASSVLSDIISIMKKSPYVIKGNYVEYTLNEKDIVALDKLLKKANEGILKNKEHNLHGNYFEFFDNSNYEKTIEQVSHLVSSAQELLKLPIR